MARIFISYRRLPSTMLATLIAKELKRYGHSAFVDTRAVDGGGPFPERLLRAIEDADVFVCLLSDTTLESEWVLEEIRHAHKLGKLMLPVFQERYIAPTPPLEPALAALLQHDGIHMLDVRNLNIDESIAKLAQMVQGKRRFPARIKLLFVLFLLTLLIGAAVLLPLLAGGGGQTQTPNAVQNSETLTDILTAPPTNMPTETSTAAPTATNTDSPTITRTQTPTSEPTLSELDAALARARAFTGTNTDWQPFYWTFEDGVEMALVPVGCFMMGSNEGDDDEQPVHEQCFSEPFWIDRTEVTQGDFTRLGGVAADDSYFDGDERPRENITWFEARDFCARRDARLPTEREWEYAARGPANWVYPWGAAWNKNNVVWSGNSRNQTANVGSRTEGASWIGALDMSGNVWERVSTLRELYPYDAADGRESADNKTGTRVLRGGSFLVVSVSTGFLRAPNRGAGAPHVGNNLSGFRYARSSE